MKEVYSTSSLSEADIVKSFLETEGIKCMLRDRNIASSYPAVVFYSGVKVVVSDKDYDLAKQIIQDYLQEKT